jgi:hypothetical protein
MTSGTPSPTPNASRDGFSRFSGDLRLGGRYQLQGNASGQIRVCDPPQMLNLTWEFGGQTNWVNVRLAELSDGGTSLRLEHIAHVPDDFWNQYGPGAVGVGWDLAMLGLRRHLESGATLDPKQGAEWPTTEDGKEFVRGSSDDWCRASTATGTPEAAAREAAERTTASYTGQS